MAKTPARQGRLTSRACGTRPQSSARPSPSPWATSSNPPRRRRRRPPTSCRPVLTICPCSNTRPGETLRGRVAPRGRRGWLSAAVAEVAAACPSQTLSTGTGRCTSCRPRGATCRLTCSRPATPTCCSPDTTRQYIAPRSAAAAAVPWDQPLVSTQPRPVRSSSRTASRSSRRRVCKRGKTQRRGERKKAQETHTGKGATASKERKIQTRKRPRANSKCGLYHSLRALVGFGAAVWRVLRAPELAQTQARKAQKPLLWVELMRARRA
mmetsp:Transcript_60295/g.103840  ORF Transcript_60295/g.103840 Transcript_60295/m.103840 type:complete len:267 (+) Transcript_60295:64-864(+)